ncbi:alpha/beta hydrolase [Streptomyces sp. NPDC054933]
MTVGLTSNVFLIVLAVTALAVVALALWLWPRAAKKGPVQWLGRLGLIAATQIAILGVILVGANKSFGFYSSWTDLLGASAGKQVLTAGPGGARPVTVTVKGTTNAGLSGGRARAGEVQKVTFHGPASGLTTDGFVYLPPQYFQKSHENDRFPVVVALSGQPSGALPRTVSADIIANKIKPTIYVMVRPAVVPGRDVDCTDVPGGPQALAFFNQDLPMAVAGQYRTSGNPGSWGTLGDSTGGYCALKLPMTNPTRYGAGASLSAAAYSPRQDGRTGDLYAGNTQVRNESDLIWRMQHMPAPLVTLLVSGSDGPTAQFKQSAKSPTKVDSLPQATTQTTGYPQAVRWLDQQLSANAQPQG